MTADSGDFLSADVLWEAEKRRRAAKIDYRVADVREGLAQMAPESVHVVVTSSPYWGQRGYSGDQKRVWGGNPTLCIGDDSHAWIATAPPTTKNAIQGSTNGTGYHPSGHEVKQKAGLVHEWQSLPKLHRGGPPGSSVINEGRDRSALADTADIATGELCTRCSAWRGELGAEPVLDCFAWARGEPPCSSCFVCHLRTVFGGRNRPEGVWRVLRNDGVAFLNLGDGFAGSWKGASRYPESSGEIQRASKGSFTAGALAGAVPPGLKAKDLLMIPESVAMALRADGWAIRSRIVWSKGVSFDPEYSGSVMPDSANDRCTKSHELIWQLAKSNEDLFWTHRSLPGQRTPPEPDYRWVNKETHEERNEAPEGWKDIPRNPKDPVFLAGETKDERYERLWSRINLWESHDFFFDIEAIREPSASGPSDLKKMREKKKRIGGHNLEVDDPRYRAGPKTNVGKMRGVGDISGRHPRDVWQIGPGRFSGSHYAVFPTEIPELGIMAGSSEKGACSVCRAPWTRIIDVSYTNGNARNQAPQSGHHTVGKSRPASMGGMNHGDFPTGKVTRTIGWNPTCEHHDAPVVPCTVLDIFAGTGTTLIVARRLARDAIGIDISADYKALFEKRLAEEINGTPPPSMAERLAKRVRKKKVPMKSLTEF